MRLRTTCDGVLALLWAPRCAACSAVLDEPTRGVVCASCWRQVDLIVPPICGSCGSAGPAVARVVALPCCDAASSVELSVRRRATGLYRGTLRAIVHALKYHGRVSLARPLASLMKAAGHDLLDRADIVVPVPLHPFRLWSRGFNQAASLARHLGVPVADVLRPPVDVAANESHGGRTSSKRAGCVRARSCGARSGASAESHDRRRG